MYTAGAGPAGRADSQDSSCSEVFFRGSPTRLRAIRVENDGQQMGRDSPSGTLEALSCHNELGQCWQLIENAGLPNVL